MTDQKNEFVTVAVKPEHREMLRALASHEQRLMWAVIGNLIEPAYEAMLDERVTITPQGREALQAENNKAPAGETASA